MNRVSFAAILLSLTICLSFTSDKGFLAEQKNFKRVRDAYAEKETKVKTNLAAHGIDINKAELLIVAYKHEQTLELYARNKGVKKFVPVASYEICASSGSPGPKRKKGDSQVPEGFYHIDRFNPSSSYYLSLGLNYPNKSDLIKTKAADPGGDIFIHGYCVTIGCLPMTNDKIKEIYLYALEAKHHGQNQIPVYVFPFRMTEEQMKIFTGKYEHDQNLVAFWNNLRKGYNLFTDRREALQVSVAPDGDYQFK